MNLIEKFKANIDIWKIEKYTKRREFLPEYKSKGKSFLWWIV
jgi:molybdopterin synthase catalytic subunit